MVKLLAQILGPLPLRVIALTRQNHVLWVNPFAESVSGLRIRDIKGLPVAEVWPAVAGDEPLYDSIRRSRKPSTVLTQDTAGGQVRWFRTTRMPMGAGRLLLVGQDVTDTIRLLACERAIRQVRIDPLSILAALR